MATQTQTYSDTEGLFPAAEAPRCPLCDQVLPEHLTAEDLETRRRGWEETAVKAGERRVRAHLEKEHEAKTKEAVAAALAPALAEQRKALEESREQAVNQARAEEFKTIERLRKHATQLQRQLDQKTSNELGEGAEIDLYNALRTAFEDDRFRRIKKGEPGADVLHEVVHNNQVVGSILYDSKNRRAWQNRFVEKLKTDQLAGNADHAILSSSVFPSGKRQLVVQDGVIVANPARVVDLVRLLREHMVRTHRLRLSAEERDDKTRALYDFIVSERGSQLIGRFDSLAEDLLGIEVSEQKAHARVWRQRGLLLKKVQKAHSDLTSEIDRIVAGDDS